MLVLLMFFLSGLALTWGIGLALGFRYTGLGEHPLPRWLPAKFIARHWVSGLNRGFSIFFIVVAILCVILGIFLKGIPAVLLFCGALFILGPLPMCLCWKVREDMKHGAKEYIFYNVVRPPGTQSEQKRDLALFIEDDEWTSIPAITPKDVKFWQQYHVTDGLYICPCENDVLQSVDSLNLYQYIVNPDHPRMLHALARALSAINPEHTSKSPHARRTFIQLQTHAQHAISTSTGKPPPPMPSLDIPAKAKHAFEELSSLSSFRHMFKEDKEKKKSIGEDDDMDDLLWWDDDEDKDEKKENEDEPEKQEDAP